METPFTPLDQKQLGWFHWRSMITTGMGVFTDGYDLSAVGIVLPLVLVSFGQKSLTGTEASLLAGSALIGATMGALVFGLLANAGRKTFYGVDVLIMAAAALAQIFVSTVPQLIAVRFILGIGVGADYVLSPTIMAEHANAKDRGKILALGFGLFWGFGASVAAVVYLVMQALHLPPDVIWRVVLGAGAIPAASVVVLRRMMPETARFLGRIKGDAQGVRAMVHELTGHDVAIPGRMQDYQSLAYYFRHAWRPFVAACSLWFLFDIVAYAGILFGPSLIAQGMSLNPGVFNLLIEFGFVVPGGLIGVLTVDRMGRKPMQTLGFFGMGAALLAFALYRAVSGAALIPLLALALYGTQNLMSQAGPGSVSASGALGVELAPTKARASVQALTVASGRLGAFLTAFAFPLIFQHLGGSFPYYFLAAVALLAAGVTWLAIPETMGHTLEESSRETIVLT